MNTKLIPTREMLDEELEALKLDAVLYLECLSGTPLKDRPQERMRDGFILFHHVYGRCMRSKYPHLQKKYGSE